MTYRVKEIFRTLQGEGSHVGRVAVFCRFTGCNLWSGREQDREAAACRFCDTDFVGGDKYETADELATAVLQAWGDVRPRRFVVLTGGEPLLQVDDVLVAALLKRGFFIAVETNGTLPVPDRIQWICVSPKTTELTVDSGNELKLVYPQEGVPPDAFDMMSFDRFSLQPMDGPDREVNTAAAVDYCLSHPQWRLSLQTHKFLGIR